MHVITVRPATADIVLIGTVFRPGGIVSPHESELIGEYTGEINTHAACRSGAQIGCRCFQTHLEGHHIGIIAIGASRRTVHVIVGSARAGIAAIKNIHWGIGSTRTGRNERTVRDTRTARAAGTARTARAAGRAFRTFAAVITVPAFHIVLVRQRIVLSAFGAHEAFHVQ